MLTREDVLEKAKEERVKFLRLQFTDIFGALKNVAVTSEDMDRAISGKVAFDSSVVDGVVSQQERDIVLQPDPSSFLILPWRPREEAVARFICDVANPDGSPYPGCSRSVLKRVLEEVSRMGFEIMVGAEVEFYLFYTDVDGNPTTNSHDTAGFCDLTPVDLGENARRDMVLTLEEMGVDIGFSHHEKGPGQHGIILKPDNPLAIADKLVTFKFVVRTIAQRYGLHASLMPKPLNDRPGSALHMHLYLYHSEPDMQINQNQTATLNNAFGHFIAGILAHARANTAITNPLINSYKRLIPNSLTMPVNVAWSEETRNSVLRVVGYNGQKKRVEVRNPDPTCNPYLALALILNAGMEGIRHELPQPPPLTENIFQAEESLRASAHLTCLPHTLGEALREMASDPLLRATIGEYIYRQFTRVKGEEWDRFQSFVHPWELQEYLSRF